MAVATVAPLVMKEATAVGDPPVKKRKESIPDPEKTTVAIAMEGDSLEERDAWPVLNAAGPPEEMTTNVSVADAFP